MTAVTFVTVLHALILAVGVDGFADTPAEKTKSGKLTLCSYAQAHQETIETGKPMVVMVGADWCGPCQTMKKQVLPEVRRHGVLKQVSFASVNTDREAALAKKITGGGPIPQLIMFRRTRTGWLRRKLLGRQSVKSVEKFINEGLTEDGDEHAAGETQTNAL